MNARHIARRRVQSGSVVVKPQIDPRIARTPNEVQALELLRKFPEEHKTAVVHLFQRAAAREPLRENILCYFAEIGVDEAEATQRADEVVASIARGKLLEEGRRPKR